jgi:hypothetical protein
MKTTTQQVAAYARLVGHCNSLGPVYNPSKASLKIAALNATLTQAQGSIDAAITLRNTYENAVTARRQTFARAHPLTTRIVSALSASGASPELLVYARNIKRVFSNRTTSKRLLPESTPANAPGDAGNQSMPQSISHGGYEIMTTNFARLIEKLATEKLYKPNEVDLQITSLKAFLTAMRDANRNVQTAIIAMKNGRSAQKKLLYGKDGLHGTAKETKDYIKSVFGTKSDQYKAVSSLAFANEID